MNKMTGHSQTGMTIFPFLLIILFAVAVEQYWICHGSDRSQTRSSGVETAAAQVPDPSSAADDGTPATSSQDAARDSTAETSGTETKISKADDSSDTSSSASRSTPVWPENRDLYADIQRMHQEMDAMIRDANRRRQHFERMFDQPAPSASRPGEMVERFEMNMSSGEFEIQDRGDHYYIRLPMTGIDPRSSRVDVDGQTLRVSGHQSMMKQRQQDDGSMMFMQRMSSSFERSTSLPGPVIPESLQMRMNPMGIEIRVMKAT